MDIVEELRGLRAEITKLLDRVAHPLPQILTKERAAKELSIGITKLKGLIRSGRVTTVMMGKVSMISAREVMRLANEGTSPTKAPSGRTPMRPRKAPKTLSAAEEVARARALLAATRKRR